MAPEASLRSAAVTAPAAERVTSRHAGTTPGAGAATSGDPMNIPPRSAAAPAPQRRTIAPAGRDAASAPAIARSEPADARARRWSYAKQVRQWHWISSAICLIGMLGFAVTGITLNHAGAIESEPVTVRDTIVLDAGLSDDLARHDQRDGALPVGVARHLEAGFGVDLHGRAVEWSDHEVYVGLPRPGGDAFLVIDRATGTAEYERTDRGWISYFNDLHKGRHTGRAWSLFIDLFAAASIVFSVTGLALLQIHARQRSSTWPLVAAGLVVPLLIGLMLIH